MFVNVKGLTIWEFLSNKAFLILNLAKTKNYCPALAANLKKIQFDNGTKCRFLLLIFLFLKFFTPKILFLERFKNTKIFNLQSTK